MKNHKLSPLLLKYQIHECGECWWCIAQFKRYYQKFVGLISNSISYFLHIIIYNSNLVVAQFQVKTTKIFSTCQLVKEIIDLKQRLIFLYDNLIGHFTIHTCVQFSNLLFLKQDWPSWGDLLMQIYPLVVGSLSYFFSSTNSHLFSLWGALDGGSNPNTTLINLMINFTIWQ